MAFLLSNMGRQLNGSTAGIIGYGAVGSYLAEKLVALGMRVLINDPYVTANDEKSNRSILRLCWVRLISFYPLPQRLKRPKT